MREYALGSEPALLKELSGFVSGVSLSHESYVNAVAAVAAAEYVLAGIVADSLLDEYVLGIDSVGVFGNLLGPVIVEFHGHLSLALRHRHEQYTFERLAHPCSLLRILPLPEQGGERIDVQNLTAFGILEYHPAVAVEQQFVHIDSPSRPSVETLHLHQGNGRFFRRSGQNVVKPEGLAVVGR